LFVASVFGDEVADSRRLAREAAVAYKAKDYALFLEKSRAASDLRANHPTLLYNFADALALNGRADEAIDVLERVAAMGMVYAPEKDDDFSSLRSSPRFVKVVDAFAANAKPTTNTSATFAIDEPGIISEGIAYDAKTKRFFVSSVRNGVIYERDRDGNTRKIISQSRGIFGMAVDAGRRRLWAASSAIAQNVAFRKEDDGQAAVLEIDLDTNKLLRTFTPQDQTKHLFGDVLIAKNGDVYVSDSASPNIYVIRGPRPEARGLEGWVAGPFSNLQGLAFSPDEKTMYASDYSKGIFAIDVATRDAHVLPIPATVSLLGVDGLYGAGDGVLIGTQNGTNPQRVIRIRLTRDGLGIAGVDTLASNEAAFDDITLGVVAGKSFYFNGAGQWGRFDDDGKAADPTKLKSSVVLRDDFGDRRR
jgi:sugar lactone lactonase YvrE